jgi:hypothetical protein
MKVYWIDEVWNGNESESLELRSVNCKSVTLRQVRSKIGWASRGTWRATTEPGHGMLKGTYINLDQGSRFSSTKKKAIQLKSVQLKAQMNECLDDLSGLKKELDLLEELK